MEITITPVHGTDLHCQYRGQSSPQGCHVQLDPTTGVLSAAYDAEIGSGTPMDVYHGRVLRWSIPALRGSDATALLEDLASLAAVVSDGYEERWDGHNHVGALSAEAEAAREAIAARCAQTEDEGVCCVWDAGDWLGGIGGPEAQARQIGLTWPATDERLMEIEAEVEADADREGVDVLEGLGAYLIWLRAEIGPACAYEDCDRPSVGTDAENDPVCAAHGAWRSDPITPHAT